jgi:hypothetical protein
MQKFCDVLNHWERKELSAQEAGEILGMWSGSSAVIGVVTTRTGWPALRAKIADFLSDQPVAETELSSPHLNHAASSADLTQPVAGVADDD